MFVHIRFTPLTPDNLPPPPGVCGRGPPRRRFNLSARGSLYVFFDVASHGLGGITYEKVLILFNIILNII